MSWTLTKKLDTFAGPGEIKRREVVLDHQVSPEEIKRMELGSESWIFFCLSCFSTAELRTSSLWLYSAQQLRQQLRSTRVAAQWRADTALTCFLFWRRSTAALDFRVGACLGLHVQCTRGDKSSNSTHSPACLHSFFPGPHCPTLIRHLASVDVMQNDSLFRSV